MADQYWGRFKTVCIFTAIVGVGHVILVGMGLKLYINNSNPLRSELPLFQGAACHLSFKTILMGPSQAFWSLFSSLASGQAEVWAIAKLWMNRINNFTVKANVSPLVAEQYTRNGLWVRTDRKGRRVIVDSNLTIRKKLDIIFYFKQLMILVRTHILVVSKKMGIG